MSDHARRMFYEALARINDADILAQSVQTDSDSQSLLRILGFEVLLKCALHICGQTPKRHHKYTKLWNELPGYARNEILSVAFERMSGHTDFSDLDTLLKWYQFIFEDARYHYEFYEKYTLEEQHQLGEYWCEELDAPTKEAVVQYYPLELSCLIEGLRLFIEKRLFNPPLNRDAPAS